MPGLAARNQFGGQLTAAAMCVILAETIVKNILQTYKENARDWERMNDWIERIGWPQFFELTGLPFTKFHVDNWRGARHTLNASTHIRF